MHPHISAILAVILVLLSALSFAFDDEIDDWIKGNSIHIENEKIELLGLQQNEKWPVLIADFDKSGSTWGHSEAEDLLIPKSSEYFDQFTAGNTDLDIDVYSSITIPEYEYGHYGSDSGIIRDSSSDGTHLPMILAKEVVGEQIDNVDWAKYDLDNDGWVDRLLILHTSIGQEEGGDSNRIWSHFTTFDKVIDLPGDLKIGHYTMASLATGESGFGTVMHEMLHQLGAYDLYPSHGSNNQHSWKGVGDWDIMANGNWNGGGKWPAIPSASTVAEIGGDLFNEINMDWLDNSQENCEGPQVILDSITRGGSSLKINLSQSENIWIEYRDSFGFDGYLPGEGVLVTYQDESAGDPGNNELNTNPNRPFLAVIEADGNNALRTGTNDGEQTDLFTNNTSFGNSGLLIRDHDGFLVPWTANIEITDKVYVNLTSKGCNPTFSIDAPDHGASLLPNEPLIFSMSTNQACTLSTELTSSDGRIMSTDSTTLSVGDSQIISVYFSSNGIANSEVSILGTISCDNSLYNIETKVVTLGRRPIPSSFEGEIDAYASSTIVIPIQSEGDEMQRFNLEIDGPISRITSVENHVDLTGDDYIMLSIEPNGLLSPNMLVRGDLEMYDSSGEQWIVELELTAKDGASNGFQEFITPSRAIAIACILGALWVILGIKERSGGKGKSNIDEDIIQHNMEQSPVATGVDSWGRPLDEF